RAKEHETRPRLPDGDAPERRRLARDGRDDDVRAHRRRRGRDGAGGREDGGAGDGRRVTVAGITDPSRPPGSVTPATVRRAISAKVGAVADVRRGPPRRAAPTRHG